MQARRFYDLVGSPEMAWDFLASTSWSDVEELTIDMDDDSQARSAWDLGRTATRHTAAEAAPDLRFGDAILHVFRFPDGSWLALEMGWGEAERASVGATAQKALAKWGRKARPAKPPKWWRMCECPDVIRTAPRSNGEDTVYGVPNGHPAFSEAQSRRSRFERHASTFDRQEWMFWRHAEEFGAPSRIETDGERVTFIYRGDPYGCPDPRGRGEARLPYWASTLAELGWSIEDCGDVITDERESYYVAFRLTALSSAATFRLRVADATVHTRFWADLLPTTQAEITRRVVERQPTPEQVAEQIARRPARGLVSQETITAWMDTHRPGRAYTTYERGRVGSSGRRGYGGEWTGEAEGGEGYWIDKYRMFAGSWSHESDHHPEGGVLVWTEESQTKKTGLQPILPMAVSTIEGVRSALWERIFAAIRTGRDTAPPATCAIPHDAWRQRFEARFDAICAEIEQELILERDAMLAGWQAAYDEYLMALRELAESDADADTAAALACSALDYRERPARPCYVRIPSDLEWVRRWTAYHREYVAAVAEAVAAKELAAKQAAQLATPPPPEVVTHDAVPVTQQTHDGPRVTMDDLRAKFGKRRR